LLNNVYFAVRFIFYKVKLAGLKIKCIVLYCMKRKTIINGSLSRVRLFENDLEREWREQVSLSFVELRLEFDPVQTEGVQESGEALHQTQNADSQKSPECKNGPQNDTSVPAKVIMNN